jgi:uncharacterized protein (TIGR00369 family)
MPEQDRPRPTPAQLAHYAREFNNTQTLRAFGARVSFPTPDQVRVEVEIRPEFGGGMGSAEVVNGGLLAAVFDLTIGCTSALVDPTRRSATLQLSMSFERPVTGRRISAEGELTTVGGRTSFATARILDEAGNVCARCQGVVRVSSLTWDSGGSPATN